MFVVDDAYAIAKRIIPVCRLLINGNSGFEASARLLANALEHGIDEFGKASRMRNATQLIDAGSTLLNALRQSYDSLARVSVRTDMVAASVRSALLEDIDELQRTLVGLLMQEAQA